MPGARAAAGQYPGPGHQDVPGERDAAHGGHQTQEQDPPTHALPREPQGTAVIRDHEHNKLKIEGLGQNL